VSTHRDLKQAQLRLNDAVERFVAERIRERALAGEGLVIGAEYNLIDALSDWQHHCRQFDSDRPAVARDTSIAAAKTRPPAAGSLRRQVVQAVVAQHKLYSKGLTADELCVRLRRGHASVSSAVSDMELKGWIYDSRDRRPTRNNAKAIVWAPSERALAWSMEGG
jgi:hypothetical protein